MAPTIAEPGMGRLVNAAPPESKLKSRLRTILSSWATKSLAVGAIATGLDLVIGLTMRNGLHLDTRPSAMTGSIIGATFTYFANRTFAFKQDNPALASSMLKFIAVTLVSSFAHGQAVVWLTDGLGVPFVVSKVIGDLAIFTFGQLLVLRYIVFPKAKVPASERIVEAHATLTHSAQH